MRTSQKGIDLIKKYEGLRLKAYQCSAKVWTIGWGHTKGVTPNMGCSLIQAEDFLKSDILTAEVKVEKYDDTYLFTQNEFDALVSFAFNLGNIDGLTKNGTRTKDEIATKMLEYCKASGQVLQGLLKRRTEEKALFLGCDNVTENVSHETFVIDNARYYSAEYKAVFRTNCSCHIRTGSGVKKKSIKILDRGSKATCYGYYSTSGNNTWLLAQLENGQTGYISLKCLM